MGVWVGDGNLDASVANDRLSTPSTGVVLGLLKDVNVSTGDHDGQVKIRVPLVGAARESGYESELLWAEPLGADRYRIWNLPVFAYNLDMRAVVECVPDPEGGLPVAVRVVEPGDCFVVRLYFNDSASDPQIQNILDLLASRRALFEKHSRRLWAVGMRSVDDYEWVGSVLQPFVETGVLTFESGMQPDEPVLGGTPSNR